MSLGNFNPNKPGKTKQYFWATYVPRRSTASAFKMHSNRGHALNALSNYNEGILYQWDDKAEEWTEILRHENWKPSDTCDMCDTNLMVQYGSGRAYNSGYSRWVNNPTLHRGTFCRSCEKHAK